MLINMSPKSADLLLTQILMSRKKVLLLKHYLAHFEKQLAAKIARKNDLLQREVVMKHKIAAEIDAENDAKRAAGEQLGEAKMTEVVLTVTTVPDRERVQLQDEIGVLEKKLYLAVRKYHDSITSREVGEMIDRVKSGNLTLIMFPETA